MILVTGGCGYIGSHTVVELANAGEVGGQAVLGRQVKVTTPWLTERHGYDPTYKI